MVDVKAPEAWERQPGEADEAWLAFRAYRDSPPHMRRVNRTISKNAAVLTKWFRDWNWDQRVMAFDAVTDHIILEERRKVQAQTARELAIDHMMMVADMKDFITNEVAKWREQSQEQDSTAPGVTPAQLMKMLDQAVKLDRLVRGETTESIGTPDLDLSKLPPEKLEQLLELIEEAKRK